MAGFFKLLSDLLFKPHYSSDVREQLRKRYKEIRYLRKVKCPKCGEEFIIDISKAVDENGETFQCPTCEFQFMCI